MIDLMNFDKRYEIEKQESWREWARKIPALHFDPLWEVKIIPPFLGALARFWVRNGDKEVSVYFDAYSRLGFVCDNSGDPIPYYEIYDNYGGETYRFFLDETEEMMAKIRQILNGEG